MIRLNNDQLKQLAEFTSNLSLVFIATVITPLFSKIDAISLPIVLLGLIAALISLRLSMWLLRQK